MCISLVTVTIYTCSKDQIIFNDAYKLLNVILIIISVPSQKNSSVMCNGMPGGGQMPPLSDAGPAPDQHGDAGSDCQQGVKGKSGPSRHGVGWSVPPCSEACRTASGGQR